MGKRNKIKEQEQREKLEQSEGYSAEADGVRVQGEDTGEMGILKRIAFTPNYEALEGKTEEEIVAIVSETLEKVLDEECEKIGWYPDVNRKKYDILKQEDGSYLLVAYLKRGIGGRTESELVHQGIIGINQK